MRRTFAITVALGVIGCGGAAKIPTANPDAVAGIAAGLATAITLADPKAAAANAESAKQQGGVERQPKKVTENAPASALDHLDHQSTEMQDDPPVEAPSTLAPTSPLLLPRGTPVQ